MALEGVQWMSRWLDRWQDAGAHRLIDFRELAGALGRRLYLDHIGDELHLRVINEGAPPLVRPLVVNVYLPNGRTPVSLAATFDEKQMSVEVQSSKDGFNQVVVPPAPVK